jgi:hypothetical protein
VIVLLNRPSGSTDTNAPTNGGGDGGSSSSLTGRFIRWEPVDEANGYAYISVTNHGSTAGVAECTVTVRNDFGDFGFDYMVGETIGAGETFSGRMAINVGEGSFLINQGDVTDC